MLAAPPGLEIFEIRDEGPVRVTYGAQQMPLGRKVQLVGLAKGVLVTSPLARALEHEAELLAKLDHPNILKLYDLRHDEAQLWLILEDVDGPRLSELVSLGLPWRAVAAIGLDLCRALSHAHSLGETHGKLRPSSVQLTQNGRTKVFAFGERPRPQEDLAEALEPSDAGGLSPETSIGQAVSPLSDIFSLGTILYELITGKPPFGDPKDTHYASRVRNDRAKDLLGEGAKIPPALEHLINQCLEKLPSERPGSAQSVAAQLEEMIGSATLPILREALTELGFRKARPDDPAPKAQPLVRDESPAPRFLKRGQALLVLAAVAGSLLTFLALQFLPENRSGSHSQQTTVRELQKEKALLLRVVASPWAHVLVDGEHLETTPFAKPITLTPGKHTVRLEHPHAPPEERIIDGQAGEGILLNVELHVEKPLMMNRETPTPEEDTP